jgi:hypothetical protein
MDGTYFYLIKFYYHEKNDDNLPDDAITVSIKSAGDFW